MERASAKLTHEDFPKQVASAQRKFESIREHTEQSLDSKDKLLEDALLQLSVVLEELHVAAEEIHEQNESLMMAQQALAAEQKRYQELFELAPDAYLVTNTRGIIQEANQATAFLLQRQQKHLIGKPLTVYISEQERPAFRSKLNELSKVQSVQHWEISLQSHQGEVFPCAIAVSIVHDIHHQPIGFRWLIRNITPQKQAESELRRVLAQEQELNGWKTRVMNTVAHEYRAPLNVISLAANVLKDFDAKLTPEQKTQFFQKIQSNVNHLINLADDMLTHSRVASNNLSFNPSLLNLKQFCQELVETLQSTSGEQHTINFVAYGDFSEVLADEKLLKQILNNLLSNAVKYSPQGGTVHFKLSREPDLMVFYIQDNGIGIDSDDLEKLFEPFHRGKNVGTIPGTGMGLAIVKKAVELHGGRIQVKSSLGQGTQFEILLPLHLQNLAGQIRG